MEAFITTDGGELVAECNGFELYLSDYGIRGYGFGDTVQLPYEPEDQWHLADMLKDAR